MAVIGAHALLYSTQPEKLRATLRDVFGWKHVDSWAMREHRGFVREGPGL